MHNWINLELEKLLNQNQIESGNLYLYHVLTGRWVIPGRFRRVWYRWHLGGLAVSALWIEAWANRFCQRCQSRSNGHAVFTRSAPTWGQTTLKIRTNPLVTNATHPIKQGLYGTIQKESITGKGWSNDSPGHGPHLHQTSEQQKDIGIKQESNIAEVF